MKNVILLTLDATRRDVFGIYGNDKGLTPFLDSLRDKCIVFTKAQSTGPYTQAAFPGLLTSSYYLDYGKPRGLSPNRTLISEPLKQAGITTAAFHSNPYICGFFGWNQGWDIFYDSMQDQVETRIPYVRGHIINTKVINWLTRYVKNEGNKPFFLWLHYMDVHEPYLPERKYIDMVDSSLALNEDEMYNLFQNTLLKRDVSDPDKVAMLKRLYNVHVREIDTYAEKLFSTLKDLGILDNTIVIITSDHGDEFGEHGGLSHDDKPYSELIDTPLLIYGTGGSGDCDALVSNIDIAPTIINLFGLEPVPAFKGHSLLPLSSYPEKGCFGEALDQKSEKGGNINKDVYFYREKDLKVIYRADVNSWEMYDLKSDSVEKNNIINTSPQAKKLQEKLKLMVRRWSS